MGPRRGWPFAFLFLIAMAALCWVPARADTFTATAITASGQNPTFSLSGQSSGPYGYYAVYVYDNAVSVPPFLGPAAGWPGGAPIDVFYTGWTGGNSFSRIWTDSRPLFGSRTITYSFVAIALYSPGIAASGWGYIGTTANASFSITGNPTGYPITFSNFNPQASGPVNPSFNVSVTPRDRYTDDGQHQNDYVSYVLVSSNGGGFYQIGAPFSQTTWTGSYTDPTRRSSSGVYSYTVKAVGYALDPYAHDWTDENGNTGTDYGFDWNWSDPLYQATVNFTVVSGSPQTITFPNPGIQNYGGGPVNLSATASSGLPVSFSVVSGPATVSGNSLTITGAGAITVKASQAGQENVWQPAPDVLQTFTVNKSSQSISFTAPGTSTFGVAPISLSASASSGLPVTFTVASGPATVSGNTLTITGAGTITVNANQAGDSTWNAAAQVQRSFTVNKAAQTITFTAIQDRPMASAPFQLSASSSSGLPVSFTVLSGPASVSGSILTLAGTAGAITLQADQAGNSNYSAAPAVQITFYARQIPCLTSPSSVSGTVGTGFTYTGTASPAASSWSMTGNTPPGLSINSSGVISGTPTAAGVYSFLINTGNAYGVYSNPVTFTILAGGGVSIRADATNTPATPPAFTVGFNNNGAQVYWYSFTVSDPVAGVSLGTYYNPNWGNLAVNTSTVSWSDPRGYSFTGTRSFVFSFQAYNYSLGRWVQLDAQGTTTVASPTGYITAAQSNVQTGQAPTFTIFVSNNNLGSGINSITVNSPLGSTSFAVTPTITGNGTVTWTSPWTNPGTYTYQFTASGSGYSLPPATASAINDSNGQGITLTPVGGSTILYGGSGQPSFEITAVPSTQSAGDGSQATDYIIWMYGSVSGFGGWTSITNWGSPSTVNTRWQDPRGVVGIGTYTYSVKTTGYHMEPYARDYIDDNGDPATEYGFDWIWSDPLAYNTITFTVVGGQQQNITFANPGTHFLNEGTVALSASTSSGLPVTFTVLNGPATVSGSTLTLNGTGAVTVMASQAGNETFGPASVTQTFLIARGTQTITFPALADVLSGSTQNLGASSSSGLPVSYTLISGAASISGPSVTALGSGSITIQADQAGNASYAPAPPVQRTFNVRYGNPQTITFSVPATKAIGDAPFAISSTSDSGTSPTYSIVSQTPANIITLSGTTVTILGAGTATMRVNYPGSALFAPGSLDATVTITKKDQSITFGAIGSRLFSATPFTVSSTASSGLPVTLAVLSGPATISGSTITLTGTGTVTIQATQLGDTTWQPAAPVNQTFTVTAASQTISFDALANRNYGDGPVTMSATASSGMAVSYSVVSGPATLSGNTLTITGAGSITIQASQSGNSNYSAAAAVNQSFVVARVTPLVTWPSRTITTSTGSYVLKAADLNAAFIHPFNTSTTSAPSGTVTYSLVGSGAPVTAGTALSVNAVYTVRANYPGDGNYLATFADAVLTIVPPAPTIGSSSVVNAVANQAFTFQASATFSPTGWSASGLPSGLSIDSGGIISGITSQTGTFNVTLTATNAGGNGTQALTVNVYQRPSITSSLNVPIKLNVPFSYQIVATGNPTSFAATALPQGLSVDLSSGLISGTPTAVGNYAVTISAGNPGATTTATLSLNVAQTYTLSMTGTPVAGGTVSGGGVYDPGTTVSISAAPSNLYRFSGWGGTDGGQVASPSSASSTIVMSTNRSLQANFVAQASVTVTSGAGGSALGGGTFDIGSNAPVSAIPSTGYYFAGWTGSGVANPLAASTSVAVSGSASITANFAPLGAVTSLGTITFGDAVPSGVPGSAPTSSSMKAAVTNNGSSALTVTNLTTTGDFTPTVTLPFSVPAGSSVDVPVVFAPASLGLRSGMFTLITNDSASSVLLYALQGNGVNPNQPPVVSITAPASAFTGSPLTVSSTASAPNNNLTLHSIESMSPGGAWTVNVVSVAGGSSSRTIGAMFASTGTWTLRAGASTDGGATWIYSTSIPVSVSNGLVIYDVQTMAVPNAGMQLWYVPSPVVGKQFQVQRTNP